MKDYKKTTIKELLDIIRNCKEDYARGNFNLSGIPRGVFSREVGEKAQICYTLDDQTGDLALISYYPKSYEEGRIYSLLKTAGEMNKYISVNGKLQAGGISKKNPAVYILSDGMAFNNFKSGSLEKVVKKKE